MAMRRVPGVLLVMGLFLASPVAASAGDVQATRAASNSSASRVVARPAVRPLARAASGGELSRVMLALRVVLAGVDKTPTLVFDEVDAGVGGRAAVQIGRRLAESGRG